MLQQNFWRDNKEYYGIFEKGLLYSNSVYSWSDRIKCGIENEFTAVKKKITSLQTSR